MYFVDVQGTLISDEAKLPIPGAIETIEYLNSHHIPFMIVTNNTKKPSLEFLANLQSIGFAIQATQYIDPLMLLSKRLKEKNIAAYGDEQFLETLQSMGYKLDFDRPATVVIGVKKDYTSEVFAEIIDFLLKGANLLGMHETTLYAKDQKRYPGTGAILKMLEAATNVPYEVVGKPSLAFYEAAKQMLETACKKVIDYPMIAMISDDVKGDLVGAKALSMRTAFVLSGKYRKASEIIPFIDKSMHPDFICKDMSEILELIQGEEL